MARDGQTGSARWRTARWQQLPARAALLRRPRPRAGAHLHGEASASSGARGDAPSAPRRSGALTPLRRVSARRHCNRALAAPKTSESSSMLGGSGEPRAGRRERFAGHRHEPFEAGLPEKYRRSLRCRPAQVSVSCGAHWRGVVRVRAPLRGEVHSGEQAVCGIVGDGRGHNARHPARLERGGVATQAPGRDVCAQARAAGRNSDDELTSSRRAARAQ